jgi:hypothetical protein
MNRYSVMNRGENKIKDEKGINPLPYGEEIVKFNKGGYNSYLKNKCLLGNISDIFKDQR